MCIYDEAAPAAANRKVKMLGTEENSVNVKDWMARIRKQGF